MNILQSLLFKTASIVIIAVLLTTQQTQAVTPGDVFCIGNNTCNYQPGCAGVEGQDVTNVEPVDTKSVFLLGDSILRGAEDIGDLKQQLQKKGISSTVDAQGSRSIKLYKGQKTNDINIKETTGLEALENDEAYIKNAGSIVIALGTNADGAPNIYRSTLTTLVDKIEAKNSDAKLYLVNLISTKIDDLDERNKVLTDVAESNDAKVIDAKAANIALSSDKIHPTGEGYKDYTNLVVSSVTAGSPGTDTTAAAKSSCCSTTSIGPAEAALSGDTTGEAVFSYFTGKGISPAGAAGMIGNMVVESVGVEPQRQQGKVSSKTKPSDVPPGYAGGYGIVQWTPARDKILKGISPIDKAGTLAYQMDYLWKEINGRYKPMVEKLKKIDSPEQGSDIFLADFEKPAEPGATSAARQAYARAYFNLATKNTPLPKNVPSVKLDASEPLSTPEDDSSSEQNSNSGCGTQVAASSSSATGNCKSNKPVWGSSNGSGSEYTQEQLTRLFGNPGTADSHPSIKLAKVDFNGKEMQINEKVADCLKAVAADIKASGSKYKVRMMGCYRYDSNNGSTNIGLRSYHTYGVACDINWDKNPYTQASSAPYDMPDVYIKAFRDYGFTWGGNWNSVKDYMHFEYNGIKP